MKRVLLVGGGTAGHVEPALAVGKWLSDNGVGIQCEFLGTSNGIESRLVPQAGFPLHTIRKAALPRRISLSTIIWPLQFLASFLGALRIVRSCDLIIGFGGYVSTPAYVAAKVLGIPIVIHEANALPGWANRLGAQLTKNVDIAFASTRNYGGKWQSAQLVGMPIRSAIAQVADLSHAQRQEIKARVLADFGLDSGRPILFVFGGSLGAQSLNSAITQFLESAEADHFTLIHAVGLGNSLPVATSHYKPLGYIDNMADIYAIADLIISRSGAVSCAEIESVGVPAILVPLPIGNGEQEANAKDLVASDQATVISNSEFSASWLSANILSLVKKLHASSSEKSRRHASAVETIGNQALAILAERGSK